jgi:hypothetical protein
MNSNKLDPLIEGYLDYQRTVRRLAHRSIVDRASVGSGDRGLSAWIARPEGKRG